VLFTTEARKSPKIAVGLSGGVDSAVSAYLLKKEGYDVAGVYMQCWEFKEDGCSAEEDRADAVKVAAHLDIPFKHLNFINEYKSRVIENFYNEYQKGRTPNPDVLCNKEIKFGIFLDWALKNEFDYVATGHYAQIKKNDGSWDLLSAIDETKDQSYFLYLLNQVQLSHAIFPLGELRKTEVRKIAREIGLPNFDKPDSVGICFIGEVNMKEFLKNKIKTSPGQVIDVHGEVIGDHDGVQFYTVGQRHGFRVKKYHGLPMYVVGKNPEKNELIVGFAKDGVRKEFEVGSIYWHRNTNVESVKCLVRIRHLGEMYAATVKILPAEQSKVVVVLEDGVFGVAPGQSAVFYLNEVVLGGGVIQ